MAVKAFLTIPKALKLEGTPMYHDSLVPLPCVNPEAFDTLVLRAPLPVLVSFERSWSEALLPPLEAVAAAFPEALRVVRVDCTAYPALAAGYAIRIVPTMVLFQRGTPVAFLVGPVPAWGIVGTVAQALGARCLGQPGVAPCVAPPDDIVTLRAGTTCLLPFYRENGPVNPKNSPSGTELCPGCPESTPVDPILAPSTTTLTGILPCPMEAGVWLTQHS